MRERSHSGSRRHMLGVLLCLLLSAATMTPATMTPATTTPQAKNPATGPGDAQAVTPSADDRQKAMQADMGRLLQLARQLKAEVDSTRRDELSIKVIRDADEIDKLARSARGRIR